jgi:hypothetical protein
MAWIDLACRAVARGRKRQMVSASGLRVIRANPPRRVDTATRHCRSTSQAAGDSMEVTGTRSRSWFTIEECVSPSTCRLFTPASWSVVRRELVSGAVGSAWGPALGKVWDFIRSQPGLRTDGPTSSSITTRKQPARLYYATSASRLRAHLKARARCTRPKRQGAKLPSPSTAARTTA